MLAISLLFLVKLNSEAAEISRIAKTSRLHDRELFVVVQGKKDTKENVEETGRMEKISHFPRWVREVARWNCKKDAAKQNLQNDTKKGTNNDPEKMERMNVKAERDNRGVTLVFLDNQKLNMEDMSYLSPTSLKELEDATFSALKVSNVAVQGSSLTDAASKKRLLYSKIKHPFVGAALEAWSSHRGLVVAPDHFWLLILQAVGEHVQANSEALRKSWVLHEGKKPLVVRRNAFTLDSRDNDWAGVIEEFVDQIGRFTVENASSLLDGGFSTTSIVEKLATKASVMNIVKNYFQYTVVTLCGFPSVRMEGTVEDWESLRTKTEIILTSGKLLKPFATEWLKVLTPVLDSLVLSARGEPPAGFWDRMVNHKGFVGSGGYSYISGWVNTFLPMLSGKQNPLCFKPGERLAYDTHMELELAVLPIGLCKTPVQWVYYNKKFPLELIAGFIAVAEDDKGALRPEIGWMLGRSSA